MKKDQRRIQVLRQMTEGDVKALGANRWMKEHSKGIMISCVLCFAWLVFISLYFEGYISNVIMVVPIVVWFGYFMGKTSKAGSRLWRVIKDKEQPVDLG
jgi:hypothetical protein